MKNLFLLNDNTTFKLNDTGTVIQFKASNEGQPVGIKEGQSAVFRIKNEFGFLKSVTAHTNYDGYVFELDTGYLTDLVPDTYSVELLVKLDSDNELIFPDEGFVQFTITPNALNITGEQLPMMSLDSFKNELKTYVDNQTTELKSDFDTYVASVKTGPQGEQGPQGEAATINIGTVETNTNNQASIVNTGTDTNAVLNFDIPVDGEAIKVANAAKETAETAKANSSQAIDTSNSALNQIQNNTGTVNNLNAQFSELKNTVNIAPNNLLPNADFFQKWDNDFRKIGDATNITVNPNGFGFNNSIKFSVAGQTSKVYYGISIKNMIPIKPGTVISYGCYIKANNLDMSGKFEMGMYRDSSANRIANDGILIDSPTYDDWKFISKENVVVPNDANLLRPFWFAYQNGEIEIAQPIIVVGDKLPNTWLPSISALSKQVAQLHDLLQQ